MKFKLNSRPWHLVESAWPAKPTLPLNRRVLCFTFITGAAACAALTFASFSGDTGHQPTAGPTVAKNARAAETAVYTTSQATPEIMATGTVKPSLLVEVGTQLSGTLSELLVDFNDPVRKGEALARLEPDTFAANLREAEAALSIARAKAVWQTAAVTRAEAVAMTAASELERASARLVRARAQFARSKRDLDRKAALAERGNLAQSELDRVRTEMSVGAATVREVNAELSASQAKVASADAELEMARSELLVSKATVDQRKAAVDRAKVDLERSTIRSPIDGLVIDRKIDVGQTVAASLNAPTLFTIAHDLGEIEVHARVDEADVGLIRIDQSVQFTVDAYRDRSFDGRVRQIRKSPTLVQNVVTYTIVVSAENRDRVLFPGMTALVNIQVGEAPAAQDEEDNPALGTGPYLSSSVMLRQY